MEWMIKNSRGENICVRADACSNADNYKLAFICHGITGYKEQDVILQTSKALQSLGYRVISFDCRNSRGQSFNNGKCATLTDFYDDLRTVIDWAKEQNFFTYPFLLAGHSLGGAVALHYAEQHPDLIKALMLISSVFSSKQLLNNTQNFTPNFFNQLQNGGIMRSRNGVDCYLDFSYLEDLQKYDFYRDINNLSQPTLLITGDKDTASLPKDNKDFYAKLSATKELYILDNCSHIYETELNKSELYNIITDFISGKVF